MNLPQNFKLITIPEYKNTFFGYYDISPFSPINDQLMLIHANNVKAKKEFSTKESTSVGFFNLTNNQFIKVDETFAWNWQQGSRLQWLDGESFIYNYFDTKTNQLLAKCYNTKSGQFTTFNYPVQSTFQKKYYLSLDYLDLSKYSEYGYTGLNINMQADGIYQCFYDDRVPVCLIRKNELKNYFPQLCFNKDHVNHIMISPNGDQFIFTYRFYINKNRFDNLFSYNITTNKLLLHIKMEIISHCNWINNNSLIIWGNVMNQKGYYSLELRSNSLILLVDNPNDGHPTFINENEFITDTYPNKKWEQELHIFDIQKCIKKNILTIPHPVIKSRSRTRCDLHPSISTNKKIVQIDSRFLNNRVVIIGKINY